MNIYGKVKKGWCTISKKDYYFRSGLEKDFAQFLHKMYISKYIKEWTYEPKIFVFEGIKSGTTSYKPDFYIKNKDNICFWVECKGYMDSKSKTKLKRFLKYFKDEKIILITRNDIFEKIICDDIENLFLTKKMIF